MKASRIALLAGVAMALAPAVPSHAAGNSWLIAGTGSVVNVTSTAFQKQTCSSSIYSSPLNGVDAEIINVHDWVNTPKTFSWSSPAATQFSRVDVLFFTAGCAERRTGVDQSLAGGAKSFMVPGDAQWAVVETFEVPAVTVSVS